MRNDQQKFQSKAQLAMLDLHQLWTDAEHFFFTPFRWAAEYVNGTDHWKEFEKNLNK